MPASEESRAAVAETHSGIVFFTADRAYKLKKPVGLGFLDFRRREAREAACRREVELNRRLAPDVYLGVADVTGPDGRLCDHLVVMRRLPAARSLAVLATSGQPPGVAAGQPPGRADGQPPGRADGQPSAADLRPLARLLAEFHARAETSPRIAAVAGRDAQAARWEANAAEMARFTGRVFDARTSGRVLGLARRYLAGREPLFTQRAAAGRARDGHGDLLAGDIYLLDDGPRVLDCLEFDDALRWGDVLADIAFLAMDLERLGRPDMAAQFLSAYREFAREDWPDSLAHHYIAYRAQVRAKVAALSWEQAGAGTPDGEQAARSARLLLDLAARHLTAGRVRLVVVGGLPGTGKSTLSARLADALGATVIRSDEVRKDVAGLSATTAAPAPFGQGLYRPEMTEATYRALLARAGEALHHGRSVIADASWHDPAWRAAARDLASDASADLTELRCELPIEVIVDRISGRAAVGGGASDATVSVVRRLAASRQPWPSAIEVDTTPPPGKVLDVVLDLLGAPGGTGGREHRPAR